MICWWPSCCSSSPTSYECSPCSLGYPLLPFDVHKISCWSRLIERVWFQGVLTLPFLCLFTCSVPPRTCSPWMTNIHNTMLAFRSSQASDRAVPPYTLPVFLSSYNTLSVLCDRPCYCEFRSKKDWFGQVCATCFFKYSARQYATTVTYLLGDWLGWLYCWLIGWLWLTLPNRRFLFKRPATWPVPSCYYYNLFLRVPALQPQPPRTRTNQTDGQALEARIWSPMEVIRWMDRCLGYCISTTIDRSIGI